MSPIAWLEPASTAISFAVSSELPPPIETTPSIALRPRCLDRAEDHRLRRIGDHLVEDPDVDPGRAQAGERRLGQPELQDHRVGDEGDLAAAAAGHDLADLRRRPDLAEDRAGGLEGEGFHGAPQIGETRLPSLAVSFMFSA